MKISRFISTLLIAIFILTACTPKTSATAPASEPTLAQRTVHRRITQGRKSSGSTRIMKAIPGLMVLQKACIQF